MPIWTYTYMGICLYGHILGHSAHVGICHMAYMGICGAHRNLVSATEVCPSHS